MCTHLGSWGRHTRGRRRKQGHGPGSCTPGAPRSPPGMKGKARSGDLLSASLCLKGASTCNAHRDPFLPSKSFHDPLVLLQQRLNPHLSPQDPEGLHLCPHLPHLSPLSGSSHTSLPGASQTSSASKLLRVFEICYCPLLDTACINPEVCSCAVQRRPEQLCMAAGGLSLCLSCLPSDLKAPSSLSSKVLSSEKPS